MSQTTLPTTRSLTLTRAQVAPRLSLRYTILLGLGGVLLLVFMLALALGSVNIPLNDILRVLVGQDASKESWTNIILKIRLPKTLTAIACGAALGTSGLLMQTYFRNPLAGPFILGISSGASLGVALVVLVTGSVGTMVLTGLSIQGDLALVLAASVGAGLTMGLVLILARHVRNQMTLLILGLMVGYLTSALVSLLLYFSIPERIQAYVNWTFGTFNGVTWSQLQLLIPIVLLGLVLSMALTKSLNALLLGERYAASMGMNVRRVRLLVILSTSILAGSITAFCGPIGFIGIAVPHIGRILLGTSDHRVLLPATALLGAITALFAAIIAEVPGSHIVLPLNAVTAFIGAPVVIWVILSRRMNRSL